MVALLFFGVSHFKREMGLKSLSARNCLAPRFRPRFQSKVDKSQDLGMRSG